ncbi:MAG TPA: nucleic acid-binding protein [Cyanothece sp. UBA12306]|nr:nucleic acid-binding protein [Cyanothece sp. UBA12306]
MIVFIDSGVLGLLTNPNKEGQPIACENWLYSLLGKGVYVISSDVCDYEVRRSLLLEKAKNPRNDSVNNLDELREIIDFLKLETEVMFSASETWVEARQQGRKTADDSSFDVDMLIIAHWRLLKKKYPSRYIVIATTNVKHLGEFTEALNWQEIQL